MHHSHSSWTASETKKKTDGGQGEECREVQLYEVRIAASCVKRVSSSWWAEKDAKRVF